MTAPQIIRRDKLACAGCGREVARRARQQRFCSARCRNREIGRWRVRKAFLGRDTRAPANPPKKDNKFKALQRAKTLSSHRIFGPADVLAVELFDRNWKPGISSGGVAVEIGRLRVRALVTL
jgi:endogenous inhibitor of DNA gyrase (YacG/DUF329 family)